MLRAALALLAAALLTGGCGEREGPTEPYPSPTPILYEIVSGDGQIEGWLFGTIHALPAGTEWRTAQIDAIVERADSLVVEAIPPGGGEPGPSAFARLAYSDGQAPLTGKVPAALRPRLAEMLADGGLDDSGFERTETWAAAIILAQAVRVGDAANGVDRALIGMFSRGPMIELEGVANQLAIFDRLPEREQRDMLAAVVSDYARRKKEPDRLIRLWLAGDADALESEFDHGMLADPELYEALLAGRNRAWGERLGEMLRSDTRPLIAVGAAHLLGEDGLVRMLEDAGFTLRRIH